MLQHIVKVCQYLLYNLPDAVKIRNYLDGRLDRKTQEFFQFGYFPSRELIGALLNDVEEEDLIKSGLAYYYNFNDMSGKHKVISSMFFDHNLIMPYRDVYGNIVSIVGRTSLSEDDRKKNDIAKYMNTNFKKGQHLFGLYETKNEIIRKNEAFLVEGQFDCIQAYNKGMRNVVAVGSANISSDQLALLGRYTDNIKILFDNDNAGDRGRDRAHKKFDAFINLKDERLPEGYKDLDEFLLDENEFI